MEGGAVIVMILALLALIGVVVFFVYDFLRHKDDNVKDFKETGTRIDTEKQDRLSNLKFVVDQVNDVNNDIYDTMMSNVGRLETSDSNLKIFQTSMLDGLNSFFEFSSNSIDGTRHPIQLADLPGTVNPNVELIQHITAMMGMTVKDLDGATGNTVKFCSKADPTKCVHIPNENGDVVLQGLATNGKVVVDSPMSVSGSVQLTNQGTPSTSPVSLSTDGTSMFLSADKVAVGNNNPSAKFHLTSETAVDPMKISIGASDAILVSADGSLITSKPITFKTNLADQGSVGTFAIAKDEQNLDILKLTVTNRLHIQGDLSVSGTTKVGGQTVAVVPPAVPGQ